VSRREKWVRKFWAERSEFWQDTVKLQRAAATAAIQNRYDPKAAPVYESGPALKTSWELACMPLAEREAVSHANGWQKLGTGRWVKCYGPKPEPKLDRAPAYLGTASTFGNGRARFNHYTYEDVGDPGCIPDLDSPETREWCKNNGHDYVDRTDGFSGPATFGNRKDLERCMKETGHSYHDRSSNLTTPAEKAKDDFRRKHGREFRPQAPVMRLSDEQLAEMTDGE
jgi:hypothetical protein